MNRRNFMKIAGVAASASIMPAQTLLANQDKKKPNIIYLMMDEWGYYESSCMGHPLLRTPNIDKFVSQGIRFTRFLAGGNVCAPTRSTLMTGQHTGHTTIRANSGGASLAAEDVTIASLLKKAGYATGGFGKWGLGDSGTTGVPEKHGFDTFFGYYHQIHAHTYYPDYLIRNSVKVPIRGKFSHYLIYEESVKFIRQNKDRPFFAYLPWTVPHGLWSIPDDEPAWQRFKDQEWEATSQRGPKDAQMYAAMIEMADRQVGELMDLLKELGIEKNTIFFLCGDNGGQDYFENDKYPDGFFGPNVNPATGKRFRGQKGEFYEGGLRIPFFVRWPGKIKPGSVSDHLGYFPDIMPTLGEIAGFAPAKNSDGISIAPTLLGEDAVGRKQEQHEFLYWEDKWSCAVTMGKWKAVRPRGKKKFALYDLSVDLEEKNNISDRHPEIMKKIQEFAKSASTPPRNGKVLDPTVRFGRK